MMNVQLCVRMRASAQVALWRALAELDCREATSSGTPPLATICARHESADHKKAQSINIKSKQNCIVPCSTVTRAQAECSSSAMRTWTISIRDFCHDRNRVLLRGAAFLPHASNDFGQSPRCHHSHGTTRCTGEWGRGRLSEQCAKALRYATVAMRSAVVFRCWLFCTHGDRVVG